MKKSIYIITGLVFVMITVLWCDHDVNSIINSPNSVGYEKNWDLQIVFFMITRFPILLLCFLGIFFIEKKMLRKRESSKGMKSSF